MFKILLSMMLIIMSVTALAQEKEKEPNKIVDIDPITVVNKENTSTENMPKIMAGGYWKEYSKSWESQKATNLKDALDWVPGVFVQQRNGAESSRVSIRGSGLGRSFQGGGLMLLQDGIPINTADGSFDFQAIDPWLNQSVEIYRGANGLTMGGIGLGGVVNFISMDDKTESYSNIKLNAGSFSTRHGLYSYQNSNEKSYFKLAATYFNQDGFRQQNKQVSKRLLTHYGFKGQQDSYHQFSAYHLDTKAHLPSSLSKELISDDPRQSRGFNIRGNFNRDLVLSRISYQYKNESILGGNFQGDWFLFQRKLDNPVFTYINRDIEDVGFRLSWNNNKGLNLGLNYQSGDQDELRRENELGLPGDQRLSRKQNAVSISAHIEKKWFHSQKMVFATSLQAIYAKRNIDESFPQFITSHRSYNQLNPRLDFSYYLDSNSYLFANLSRSFEPPTFSELNNGNQPGVNLNIKAQSADTLEIGGRGQFSNNLQWDVSFYHSKLDDEFIRFRFPDGSTRTTNADKSIHTGLELGTRWQISKALLSEEDELSLRGSYLWSDFILNNHTTYGDNQIPGIPEHYIRLGLYYKHLSWNVSPYLEWVPNGYYVDLANTFKTDAYAIWGLNFSYQVTSNLDLFVQGKNLSDKTYISTSLPIPDAQSRDGNYFYSGEGRALYLGLNWKF